LPEAPVHPGGDTRSEVRVLPGAEGWIGRRRTFCQYFCAFTVGLAPGAGLGLLSYSLDDVDGRLESRDHLIILEDRAGQDEAQKSRPFGLSLVPVELGSIPDDLHEPDALLDVVLVSLFMPLDPGLDLDTGPQQGRRDLAGQHGTPDPGEGLNGDGLRESFTWAIIGSLFSQRPEQ
jgi:hypothetical protein